MLGDPSRELEGSVDALTADSGVVVVGRSWKVVWTCVVGQGLCRVVVVP